MDITTQIGPGGFGVVYRPQGVSGYDAAQKQVVLRHRCRRGYWVKGIAGELRFVRDDSTGG